MNEKESPQIIEVFVLIKEGANNYYLLKVQKRGFDVYCFLPDLGLHHSKHRSGISHFRYEGQAEKTDKEPPAALVMGEAGTPIINGIKGTSLLGLGHASRIYSTVYLIDSLEQDFRKFNKITGECFVIDRGLFSKDAEAVEVGVWAVPERNKISFEFNNPNIPEHLLYKHVQCEPQIWIYARPF
jgi:hypothetical protein